VKPKLVPFERETAAEERVDGATRQGFNDLGETSRWFDTIVTSDLASGETDGPRVFPSAETWYFLVDGDAEFVNPNGSVETLSRFDGVFFLPGTGGELRATSGHGLTWLTIASAGGSPTPFSSDGGRGEASRGDISTAKPPIPFRRRQIATRQWPANPLGASAKPWWFYTVDDESQWFHSACISCIAPGGSSTFHSHMERFEGPYETFYINLSGTAFVRNEYEDFLFDAPPGGVYVPADASHQIINNGEDFLWYLTISSRGDTPLRVNTYDMPSGVDRPGYLEEYNRIIAARAANGLPTP
jgi:mannose-6-phosphate isomerase-like protein (cupin superfamily)